jgi:hypothetical protein
MTLRKSVLSALVPALFSIACSEAAPPTARGALRVVLVPPSDSEHASDCQFDLQEAEAYIGGDRDLKYPDEFELGARVVDHQSGSSVSCTVRSAGAGMFAVQGHMRRGVVDLTMNGTVPAISDGGTATGNGNVSLVTPATVGQGLTPVEDDSCVFTPIEVAAGRVWSRFDCGLLKASGQLAYCGATGFFVFENCER